MKKCKTKINDLMLIIVLCVALVSILVLKVYFNDSDQSTSSFADQTEFDQTVPVAIPKANNEQKLLVEENDHSVVSSVVGQPVTDPSQKKEIFDRAVQSIILTDQIKNNSADLDQSNAFHRLVKQHYWWDIFQLFDQYSPLTAANDQMNIVSDFSIKTITVTINSPDNNSLRMITDWPQADIRQFSNGNYLLYEVDQTTSVVEAMSADKFSQNIIFQFKPDISNITTTLSPSTDLSIFQTDSGELIVINHDNAGWFFIGSAKLVDRKGNSIIIPLQYNSSTQQIIWSLDQQFMQNASYPVVLQL